MMRRRVKEFVEISDHTSLDMLIRTLSAIRDTLGDGAEPEMKLKGDDVFGRRLSISYFREMTGDEAAIEDRYAHAHHTADAVAIDKLQAVLDRIPSASEQHIRDAA